MNLHAGLVANGFREDNTDSSEALADFVNRIRPLVHDKTGSVLLENELYKNNEEYEDFFLVEPYGTQNYPDIMVFTKEKVIMVESKFSTNSGTKPMWNSNIPKQDSFYIFGSKGRKDVAIFTGDSIVSPAVRARLVEITNQSVEFTKNSISEFKDEYEEGNDFNITVYPRMAYAQAGSLIDKKEKLYDDVIKLIDKHNL